MVETPVDQHQVIHDRGGSTDLRLSFEPALQALYLAQILGFFERSGVIRAEHDVEGVGALQVLVQRFGAAVKRAPRFHERGAHSDLEQRHHGDDSYDGTDAEDLPAMEHVEFRQPVRNAVDEAPLPSRGSAARYGK
jgi:hypothetical protein